MSEFIEVFRQFDWKEFLGGISAIAFLLFAIAVLISVFRVRSIIEALREFQRSRSGLSELLDAVDSFGKLTPKLTNLVADLQEDISATKSPAPEAPKTPGGILVGVNQEAKEAWDGSQGWREMLALWREARDGMEETISNLDGRRRRPYNNKYRHNYSEIIDMLVEDGKLTLAKAEAAKAMNTFLLSKKNSDKTKITENDVKEFRAWKNAFDRVDSDGR